MLTKPLHCAMCPLYGSGQGFSKAEGTGKNGVLILGEALGRNEALDGFPFRPYAESGSILEAALSRLGLRRQDFALFNIVNCAPPNNKLENMPYEKDAVERCSKYVREVVEKFKPKVILALGNIPLRYTWKEYPDLSQKLRESGMSKQEIRAQVKKLSNTSVRGYTLPSIYNIPVISSLHPSFIRRTGVVYLGVLIRDIRLAILLSQGKLTQFEHNYKTNPDESYLHNVLNYLTSNVSFPLSYDIETPFSILEADEKEVEYRNIPVRDIDSIQFSHKPGEAFFLTLGKEKELNTNWEWARKFLSLPNPKIGFNSWEFDDTNIKYHFGEEFPLGGSIDEMWMCKFYNQDFGASKLTSHGLSLAWNTSLLQEGIPAWKHLSNADPFLYGNIDADVTLRNFLTLEKEFKARKLTQDCFGKPVTHTKTIWEGFQDDIVSLNPILKAAAKRGFPIDVKGREEYKKKLRAEIKKVNKYLQEKYPTELLKAKPEKGYANVPKEVEIIRRVFGRTKYMVATEASYLVVMPNGNVSNVTDNSNSNGNILHDKIFLRLVERFTRRKEKPSETGLVLRKFMLDSGVLQERWCHLENFKVGSKPQVLAYIEHKGYKLKQKKNKTSHKLEASTSKDVITQLYEETRDKFLGNIVLLRELQKLLSTYTGESKKKADWNILNIDAEGVGEVNTTFGYWPNSGQLSSRGPNIHNFPKYGGQWNSPEYIEWAKEFRKIVKARKGKVLLEFDYKSYHALTTAFEAEDAEYMRLVRMDIHSYFAAHIIRNGFPIELSKLKSQMVFLSKSLTDKRRKVEERIKLIEESLEFTKDLSNWLKYDDEILKKKLKWIKQNHEFIRNRMAKPTILGIPYGMGAGRLYEENIRNFESKEQAQILLTLIQRLFPKIFAWQNRIRQEADKKGYLISRYGYLQRFYNVYDYRPLKEKRGAGWNETIFLGNDQRWWSKKPGSDSENVVSFYPQNDAFGKIKEAIRDCDELEYLSRYGFCNTIHDSLMFECDERLKDECIANVKPIMERPARFLVNSISPNGLVCGVDVSVGRNWGGYHEIKNPEGLREIA